MDINEFHKHLICVKCRGDLERTAEGYLCLSCNALFDVAEGKVFFQEYKEAANGLLDILKITFKKIPGLYDFLVKTFSPILFQEFIDSWPLKISDTLTEPEIRLNLGSGNSSPRKGFINIDGVQYKNVSIVCDIARLPFRDNSVALVVLTAVLEHVKDDNAVVREVDRVLHSGGVVCCAYPFVQGFHASPFDYNRRTIVGLRELFKEYEILDLRPYGGPTSGLLWVLQEWLAIIFSFGSRPVYNIIHPIIMILTFPIKYFDLILIRHPMASQISSGFYIVAKKV